MFVQLWRLWHGFLGVAGPRNRKLENLTSKYHPVTGENVACLEFSDDRPGISNDEPHRMYNSGSLGSDSESMAVLTALWWTWIHWILWRLR